MSINVNNLFNFSRSLPAPFDKATRKVALSCSHKYNCNSIYKRAFKNSYKYQAFSVRLHKIGIERFFDYVFDIFLYISTIRGPPFVLIFQNKIGG